jgi:pimeloyl-ACP methyl ester carboxylesterase
VNGDARDPLEALHTCEWGRGDPVIVLHPLGLDSAMFGEFGTRLAERNLRTIAVDLPGFGRSAAPAEPLTPRRLAEPVLELARTLERPAALLGISMGGRVALEAAFTDPDRFRSVILIAPYLPWLRFRWAMPLAQLMSPRLVERVPLELAWPVLKVVAHVLEAAPGLRDDDVAKAGARLIYYASCPATRASIVSAARELALDPAFGPQGVWDRLPALEIPTTFIWGERDRLVPLGFAHRIAEVMPHASQRVLPCLRHAINGPHHRCLVELVASILAPNASSKPRSRARQTGRTATRRRTARLRREPCRQERAASAART